MAADSRKYSASSRQRLTSLAPLLLSSVQHATATVIAPTRRQAHWMELITSLADLEGALRLPLLLLFKHSRACPVSKDAWNDVARLEQLLPTLPLFLLDVREQRELAHSVARTLGVRHESPQAILIRDGAMVWHGSHFAVSAAAVIRELDSATT